MGKAQSEYRYNRLTWPEMNEAIGMRKLILLPTGSTEQHGRHLPLDTDVFLSEEVCLEVGRRAPDKILVLPPIAYGLNLHHIYFPGTVHIEPETFIAFCLNITMSVAYHGFEKILLVNGHGSNSPLNDLVARKTILQTESLCFACNYATFLWDKFSEIRESEIAAHADEFETSLYLHLAHERVQMDKAEESNDRIGIYVSSDSTSKYMRFDDYWVRWSQLGVHDDPKVAKIEKGRIIFEAVVEGLLDAIDELREWPIQEQAAMHENPTQ